MNRPGMKAADLCRQHGITEANSWKAKYRGLEVSEAKRLKALESENAKLKKLLADAMLDNAALKDVLAKNGDARCQASGGRAAARSCRTAGERLGGPPPPPPNRASPTARLESALDKSSGQRHGLWPRSAGASATDACMSCYRPGVVLDLGWGRDRTASGTA
jgi:putative transposase